MAHSHPLDAVGVRVARGAVMSREQAERATERLAILSEPTRLRLLQALDRVPELCVGDAALAVGVSDDSASYALRQLRASGLVDARREGRAIFYGLAEGFPRTLLRDCALALSEAEGVDPVSEAADREVKP